MNLEDHRSYFIAWKSEYRKTLIRKIASKQFFLRKKNKIVESAE